MGLLEKIFKKKTPVRNKETGTPIERYWKSFKHAIDGIIYCLKYEHNMIIILTATILVVLFGFEFNISTAEWLFIIFICGAIAACELITKDYNELAKIAKDTASSASLILCTAALIGGLIIFLPKIIILIGG